MIPPSRQCQAIARILCDATEQILWQQVQPWLEQRPGVHRLRCRVGSGEATYYSPRGEGVHLLTYGRKMVASKFDASLAVQWRTGREILERNYFDGELSLPAVLAHTCCHEFGHVIQGIKGWIQRGSIHNAGFYHIVDRIHHSGSAKQVRQYIEQCAAERDLPLSFTESSPSPVVVDSFRPGELVSFDYRGLPVLGEVLRVNRKTVNVKPVLPRLAADYFRISPQFLRHHK